MTETVLFEHRVETRWRDSDALGHVNHTAFLTYLEEARDAWLLATLGSNRLYVVARIEIDLKAELWPNTGPVTVQISLDQLGTSKIVTSEELIGPDGTTAAHARVVIVRWDERSHRPVSLTDSERDLLSKPVHMLAAENE